MNILYIGSFSPSYLVKEFSQYSLGKYHTFQDLIKGIGYNDNVKSFIITSPDIPSYPKFPSIYVKSAKKDGVLMISTLNIPVIKQIWTLIALLVASISIIKKNNIDIVFIPYMVFKHVLLARMLQILFRKKVCILIPDVFFPTKKIHYYINKYTEKIVLKFDAFVLYTKQMAGCLKITKPYIVMEGILDTSMYLDSESVERTVTTDRKIILYTGTLAKQYGILRLVESMKYIDDADIELHLYGDGDALPNIKEAALHDKRIVYKGWVDKQTIMSSLRNAMVLVNPRSVDDGEFTEYSCPSKILEYLLSGTPSIICKLPGIPDEYFKHFFITDGSPKDIARSIMEVSKLSDSERKIWSKRTIDFVVNRVDIKNQGKRVYNYLTTLK